MVMMAGSETPKAKGSDSDLGPQASSSSESINYFSEFGILILRLGVSILMVHNGLEKLQNPEGFSEFVISQHLNFLPGDPLLWTYAAALTEIICPIGIAFGLATRLCALGLLSTMAFAITYHLFDTGLQGFPFAVVENHSYAFELSGVYATTFFYLLCAGPGRISLAARNKAKANSVRMKLIKEINKVKI
ncbi:DoxX family protein [Prochlorococcus marinus]|uniref:DoxX family protein n=2 Tax=Prochlorococcus TaxID=1218 RepID=UPI0007B36CFC|nr:DoxX family protein [Prochlorococcus marinus]KZR68471.1 DoxX [Prochlorococcus marinus str. MIT 1313]KZR71292.1 DoxX [Prochlorococcus marinus str. MIT 1318]MEC7739068.1 DoxX family protein [Cyanobacteriota bacterium]KZR74296.1 DoxX [Prochlorococcus marinus str. MIT 1323]MED5264347.1 DoxX family protein [Cyanobacteriota bacterium]